VVAELIEVQHVPHEMHYIGLGVLEKLLHHRDRAVVLEGAL